MKIIILIKIQSDLFHKIVYAHDHNAIHMLHILGPIHGMEAPHVLWYLHMEIHIDIHIDIDKYKQEISKHKQNKLNQYRKTLNND